MIKPNEITNKALFVLKAKACAFSRVRLKKMHMPFLLCFPQQQTAKKKSFHAGLVGNQIIHLHIKTDKIT